MKIANAEKLLKPKENQCFFEPNFKNQLKPKENLRKINANIKNIEKPNKNQCENSFRQCQKSMIQVNHIKTL